MDYYPNQQAMIRFCDRLLPLIRQRRPSANLIIIGANPSARIRKLAQIDGVTVTGSVPDVRPYVTKSTVSVAPLEIARGTQNKILEAMAMGVPVVTTPVAAAGVDVVTGEHLLCGETDQEISEMTLQILDSREKRETLARKGRQRILECHDWNSSMRQLDAILDKKFRFGKSERSKNVNALRSE
jgi:glycosyltransferase involved in cell wall biosynthesis